MKISFSARLILLAGLAVLLGGTVNLGVPAANLSAAVVPELPREQVDSAYPALSENRTVYRVRQNCATEVNCFSVLQQAIDAANLGDEILIQPGIVITGPVMLKNKPGGSGWIIIRTENISGLTQEGVRVSPSNSAAMAKIMSSGLNLPAIEAEAGAHHYRLVGLEVAKASPTAVVTNLVYLGSDDNSSLEQVPHHLVLDRMYLHGDKTSNLRRCLTLNSAHTAIIDSYLADCHDNGADSQAIGGWNGPGPFLIANNYLEGAGENLMFGGADPKIQNLIPSDIEVTGNYFNKPLQWKVGDPSYGGYKWVVKNLFELKTGRRVLVEGNIFDHSWTDGQNGVAILLKSANQGACSWCETSDVTFRNNIVKNTEQGMVLNGAEGSLPLPPPVKRISVSNVLFENISGRLFQVFNKVSDLSFDHVTGFGRYSILFGDAGNGSINPKFSLTNSILQRGEYGIGAGSVEGSAYLNSWFSPYRFDKNLLLNTSSDTNSLLLSKYPAGTFVAAGLEGAKFENLVAGNYRLSPESVYKNVGTDGKDLGADIVAVNQAVAGTLSGVRQLSAPVVPVPVPTPAPSPSPAPNPSPVPVPDFPRATFATNKLAIYAGQKANLSWVVENADTAVIAPEVGNVNTSGSLLVSPSTTTTYVLEAKNSYGATSRSLTIQVLGVKHKFRDGSLISDRGTIYAIEFGKKRGITNERVFNGFGYKFSEAITADTIGIEAGDPLDSANQRHPRGTLVNDSGTIYYMGADKRYAFTSSEIFISWGCKFGEVVAANRHDLFLPKGPHVELNK